MKLVPRYSQVVGRMVIRRSSSTIIIGDDTKVTKFLLVDAVGEGAAKAGVKVGDIVVPVALTNIVLDSGYSFCPFLEEKNIAFFVRDVNVDQLLIQTPAGTKYVPFDSPEAAKAVGAQEEAVAQPEAA